MDIKNITQNIIALSEGQEIALNLVIEGLYYQLNQMAQGQLAKLNPLKMTPNDLVHELYLKLSFGQSIKAQTRAHFLAIAATAMRHLIVDQLKAQQSQKRGGDFIAVTLSDSVVPMNENVTEILAVDKALAQLKLLNSQLSDTVECKFFAGYTEEETALALGVNERTVRRYWKRAKNWLQLELYSN
jgi:RNA polymerase sigma factor (TIGR02999 family)